MKTTEELMNEIVEQGENGLFFEENQEEFKSLSLSAFLQKMLSKYHVVKADLFRRAGMVGNNYGYELFQSDKKRPSRDMLLSLCLAFPLSLEETQYALRCCGMAVLYPRDKRDAYILYGLVNQLSLDAINDLLVEKKLNSLH